MKILVLLKYSLDVSEIKVDAKTHELHLGGVPEKIGNIDRNVVEAAVRLKESTGGTVQALTLGPAAAKDGFRDVLAMGVDEAYLVEDPFNGQAEASDAVRVLEAAVRKLGPFDLILGGFASDDGYTYQTLPRLAERLRLPLVSYVCQMSITGDTLQADRDLDEALQTVTTSLPSIASVAEEAFPPRRTTLMDALKAKKKPVTVWNMEDLGLSSASLGAADSLVSASQVGIVVHRKQQVLKGEEMAALADQLIDILLAENVLKGGA